jgi:excisionase family DNA binding protein
LRDPNYDTQIGRVVVDDYSAPETDSPLPSHPAMEWMSARFPPKKPSMSVVSTGLHSEWLTASEAALYLKVQTRTVLLWVRQGKLKGYALSGAKRHVWRFRAVDLDRMMMEPSVAFGNRRIP